MMALWLKMRLDIGLALPFTPNRILRSQSPRLQCNIVLEAFQLFSVFRRNLGVAGNAEAIWHAETGSAQ